MDLMQIYVDYFNIKRSHLSLNRNILQRADNSDATSDSAKFLAIPSLADLITGISGKELYNLAINEPRLSSFIKQEIF